MRRTLLDNSSRWTLSFPNVDLVPGAFGEFDLRVLIPIFLVLVEKTFSDKNFEIHNPIV